MSKKCCQLYFLYVSVSTEIHIIILRKRIDEVPVKSPFSTKQPETSWHLARCDPLMNKSEHGEAMILSYTTTMYMMDLNLQCGGEKADKEKQSVPLVFIAYSPTWMIRNSVKILFLSQISNTRVTLSQQDNLEMKRSKRSSDMKPQKRFTVWRRQWVKLVWLWLKISVWAYIQNVTWPLMQNLSLIFETTKQHMHENNLCQIFHESLDVGIVMKVSFGCAEAALTRLTSKCPKWKCWYLPYLKV